ncbi:MAG: hypothetical protein ABIX12_00260, partial [Rubrivivax sp.]
MSERRATSLLDFVIAASLAVVPVLVGVLLLVAVVRPADPDSPWRAPADRYVSLRQMAALRTFEAAIARQGEPAAPPTATRLLAAVPACEHEWAPRWTAAWRVPGQGAAAVPSVAEQLADGLAEFDAALRRFGARPNARVSHPVAFDAERWFAAVNEALAAETVPLDARAAGAPPLRMRCADLSSALAALARSNFRMLETLDWRGTVGSTTLARWRVDQQAAIPASQMTRRNPWHGIAGCIYLGRTGDAGTPTHFVAAARSAAARVCDPSAVQAAAAPETAASGAPIAHSATPALTMLPGEPGPAIAADDPRWMVPPSLHAMLAPLETVRQPTGALYRRETEANDAALPARRNRVELDGAEVDIGYSIDLTIDPELQALAQKAAACYTGRHDICLALGMRRSGDAERPLGDA